MENKIKHLEFIQELIERLSNHSFQLKRWAVTVAIGIFAFSFKDANKSHHFISFIPVLVFWLLDGFYLYKERLFRSLFEYVRKQEENSIDFNMDNSKFIGGKNKWINAIFSTTIFTFYFGLLISMAIAIIIL